MNHPIDGSGQATLDNISVLARTMWGEARGEGDKGMVAVAFVIRNRVWDDRWPDMIKDVCQQPFQFSCWNQDDPNLPALEAVTMNDPTFMEAMTIAFQMINGDFKDDITNGADHYMTTDLFYSLNRPRWAQEDKMRVVAQIGKHVFLR